MWFLQSLQCRELFICKVSISDKGILKYAVFLYDKKIVKLIVNIFLYSVVRTSIEHLMYSHLVFWSLVTFLLIQPLRMLVAIP